MANRTTLLGLTLALWGSATLATEPFQPTVIRQKDGKWELSYGYLGGSGILVRDTKNEVTLSLDIDKAVPNDEYKKYVDKSTAGPIWEEQALPYFVELGGKPHFALRTWWGRRILINLSDAKQVSDRDFERTLAAVEKERALAVLTGGLPKPRTVSQIHLVTAAAYFAGQTKLKEAVTLLRKLEPLEISAYAQGGGYDLEGLKEGDINPHSYQAFEPRRAVQRTLRQLGEKPAVYPATSFSYETGRGGGYKPFVPAETAADRHNQANKLRRDMKPIDVLKLLGPPDYVEFLGELSKKCVWRYDLDASPAYTLFVFWNKRARVDAAERVEPALFAGDELFEPGERRVFSSAGKIGNPTALYEKRFKGKVSKVELRSDP